MLLLATCSLPAGLIEALVMQTPIPAATADLSHSPDVGNEVEMVGGRPQRDINARPLISWTIVDRQLTIL